jgi:hypothetical protein
MAEKEKEYKISDDHFALFEYTVASFLDTLSLSDWEVTVKHAPLSGHLAECYVDTTERACIITLNTVWDSTKPSDKAIRNTAIHEVFELLFMELRCMAKESTSADLVQAEIHSIINRLTNGLKLD